MCNTRYVMPSDTVRFGSLSADYNRSVLDLSMSHSFGDVEGTVSSVAMIGTVGDTMVSILDRLSPDRGGFRVCEAEVDFIRFHLCNVEGLTEDIEAHIHNGESDLLSLDIFLIGWEVDSIVHILNRITGRGIVNGGETNE